MKTKSKNATKTLTLGAILTALVIVLQILAIMTRPLMPFFSLTFVLIPIVIGAAKCGPGMGAWLGFVFGIVVLISGDAAAFLAVNIPGTIITVLLKGTLCGLAAGLAYKALEKKNQTAAVLVSSVVCPVVNTGIFLIGCLIFFLDTVKEWAVAWGAGDNFVKYMFLGLAGVNFLVEFGINILLNPVIHRLLKIKNN